MPTFLDRLSHAWNAFTSNRDPTINIGPSYGYRPDRIRLHRGNEKSIVTSVYNRIALDVAAVTIQHVRLDQNGRFVEEIHSGLNDCFSLSANLDQTGRAFMQDIVMSMFDEGCVAIVPTMLKSDIRNNEPFNIKEMRVGKIVEWFPNHVKIRIYNPDRGMDQEIILPKKFVAIIENPFFAVMNEPNSTLQRLNRKLALLDAIDEQTSSGKLDLIIQLPYVIKTEARRQQAEMRRKDIEKQLTGSKYGIAYTDGTERITQLSKPVENQLLSQIEYLIKMLYNQLGLTEEVFNGTADEKVMLNYNNRTIEPIVSAITDELKRKFLTKTARSQMQSIVFFKDPFKLVPVNQLAEIADKFTRNEIMTSNEFRQIVGLKPSAEPNADELRNKNLNISTAQTELAEEQGMLTGEDGEAVEEPMTEEEYNQRMAELDEIDSNINELEKNLK